jgi:Bor protein
MNTRSGLSILAAAALVAGCHHVTVDTGLPASGEGIHQEWASSWVFGLVPPETVETAKACPNGIAKVETQQSFLNVVVYALVGIVYAPMQIDVWCAAGKKTSALPAGAATVALKPNATAEEVQAAFTEAATRSQKEGVPVYVTF